MLDKPAEFFGDPTCTKPLVTDQVLGAYAESWRDGRLAIHPVGSGYSGTKVYDRVGSGCVESLEIAPGRPARQQYLRISSTRSRRIASSPCSSSSRACGCSRLGGNAR